MDSANSGAGFDAKQRPLDARTRGADHRAGGHLNAANRRWLALIAEFDRRKGWSDGLTQSCAHWLNWKCGIDMGAAREKVRVAHALERLPSIGAAMGRGELSYSKVRALTRVACPATEQLLLNDRAARHGASRRDVVRQFRRVQEAAEMSREARQHANRGLTYSYDRRRLAGDQGAAARRDRGRLCIGALEAAMRDLPLPNDLEDALTFPRKRRNPAIPPLIGQTGRLSARRADALGVLAESFLKHGPEALNGGERQPHRRARRCRVACRRAKAGRCELDDGPAIPVETARRLSCDASVVEILENGEGEPLDVGRKTRTIPPALRRALKSRDQGCVFPGCTHKRFVDGHHIHHWAEGGETKLSNLVSLCRTHHRAVHEGGIVDPAARRWCMAFREAQWRGAALLRTRPHAGCSATGRSWSGSPATRGIHIDARHKPSPAGAANAWITASPSIC